MGRNWPTSWRTSAFNEARPQRVPPPPPKDPDDFGIPIPPPASDPWGSPPDYEWYDIMDELGEEFKDASKKAGRWNWWAGVIAVPLLREYYKRYISDVETAFVVAPGWITICQATGDNLQGNPQWGVSPGANACGFGGPAVAGDFYSPPPLGYEGYGAPLSWNPTDGWRYGIITPSKGLQGFPVQIWFHWWHGRFPDPTGLVQPQVLPARVPVPVTDPWSPPSSPPLIEHGPTPLPPAPGAPLSPTRPMITPWPGYMPFSYPFARPARWPGTITLPVPLPLPWPGVPGAPGSPGTPPRRDTRYKRHPRQQFRVRNAPRGKPPPKVREQKWKAGRGLARALRVVGVVTEFVDVFQAAWFALPKASRSEAYRFYEGKPTFMERLLWLASHGDQVAIDELLFNMAANASGDTQAASGGRFTREMHQRMHDMGLGGLRSRGPIETWNRLREQLSELENLFVP